MRKLYIRITCTVCLAKRQSCPYCTQGKTFIEATHKVIEEYINSLKSNEKDNLLKKVLDFSGSSCYNGRES